MPAKRLPMPRPTLSAHLSIAAVLPGIWTRPSWSPWDLLPGHHGPRLKTKPRPLGRPGTRQCGISMGVPQHPGNPFGADDGPDTLGAPRYALDIEIGGPDERFRIVIGLGIPIIFAIVVGGYRG